MSCDTSLNISQYPPVHIILRNYIYCKPPALYLINPWPTSCGRGRHILNAFFILLRIKTSVWSNKKTRDMFSVRQSSLWQLWRSVGGGRGWRRVVGVLSSGNLIPWRQSCTKSPPGTPARFSPKLWKYSLAVSYFTVWSKPKQIP